MEKKYCKLCQCWHSKESIVFEKHKEYLCNRLKPKKYKRPKNSFWDSWGEEPVRRKPVKRWKW